MKNSYYHLGIAHILLVVVLSIAILSSCSRGPQYPAVLETADSLAYVNPDSAVALLRSVEAEMTASQPAVRHLYDLMTLKAQDKADLPLTSDSLILDILQYYEHGGDPNKLPEAYYYAGRVYRKLGDAPKAIDFFKKAQMMLAELDLRKLPAVNANRYEKLKGTIMAQEGYLFRNQHLYRESLDCFRDAFDLDSLANDTVGMLFDLSDLGYVLTAARDNEQALHYFDLAAKMAEAYGDSLRLENIILQKCHCLVKLKRYVEVADYLLSFSPRLTRSNSEVYCTVFGEYFWKIGESEKAVPYFKRLYESGSIYSRSNAALWFSDYEMKRGNAKEAMRYMADFSNYQQELRKLRNEEVVALTNSLYNYHLREQENLRLKSAQRIHKQTIMSLSMIAFFLICSLIALGQYMRIRQRRNNSREKQLRYLLDLMQADKEKHQHTIESEAASLRNTEIHQTINNKCNHNQGMTTKDWEDVENALRSIAPNFITNLRSVYDFSEIEWHVSLLIKLGFSAPDIAIATNHSQQSIYSIRRRLYKKVFPQGSEFKDWNDFLNSI